jgi:hypothetical protein
MFTQLIQQETVAQRFKEVILAIHYFIINTTIELLYLSF